MSGHCRKTKPELILLDVMMPEMDGIETCQHLKVRPENATIPIIFTASLSILTRLWRRVRTQLRLQEMFRKNMKLQERLGDMRKAAAVGAITRGIAHNLNNLFGGVVGYLDLIRALGFVKTSLTRFSDHLLRQKLRSVGEWGSPPPATQHAIFPEICV